jgi:hypothetical protein
MSQGIGAEVNNAGWTRRFTALGARLQEAVELYRGLGFEVRLEAAAIDSGEVADTVACAQCIVMTLAQTIYTRPPSARVDDVTTER